EEYAVLWAIEHIRCDLAGDYDVVVFDTPPTALSLRFLAMPAISERWVSELTKLRERILERRQTIVRINPGSPAVAGCVDKDEDSVYGKLGSIKRRLAGLRSLFGRESFVAVVVNKDILSISEALRISGELARIDIPLSALCVNKSGLSGAPWVLDPRLAGTPSFELDFLPGGLRGRGDLASIDTTALVAAFQASDGKGTA
ncbi:MAG TPA: ArsA-related P-loop ATPase, partial [Spirochaetales bacterium]|nr:ArsA-related P-loop ATPase [Spirochaetales bacterium]